VRYFNGILFVFTLVFLKCAHYSADFGTRMVVPQGGGVGEERSGSGLNEYMHILVVGPRSVVFYFWLTDSRPSLLPG